MLSAERRGATCICDALDSACSEGHAQCAGEYILVIEFGVNKQCMCLQGSENVIIRISKLVCSCRGGFTVTMNFSHAPSFSLRYFHCMQV